MFQKETNNPNCNASLEINLQCACTCHKLHFALIQFKTFDCYSSNLVFPYLPSSSSFIELI